MFKSVLVPIHRDGWWFIGGFALVAVLLGILWEPLGWVFAILTLWCVYFFRDPHRVVPVRSGLVVSPADGTVALIQPALPPAELGMASRPLTRISIFLSVLDVHVNRVPADGTIAAKAYRPGKFFNAYFEKASTDNERMALLLRTPEGKELAFVQIAGLIARRIICTLETGQTVRAGERFGLIRFGSRLDVYLPEVATPLVVLGQKAIAGETVIADLYGTEPPRRGEVR